MATDPATLSAAAPLACNCQALRQAARRATAMYDAAMAPHGLRISQFAVLSRLQRCGPASLHALAAGLLLDRTTLGRNLRPLERDGLIGSEGDAADRRVRLLRITPAGEALVRRSTPAWREAQAAFEQQFGGEQAGALRAELHRLVFAIRAPEPVA